MEKWELEYKIKILCQNKYYIIKPFLECIRFLAIKIQSSDTIKTPTISNPKIVFKGVLCFPFTNHPYPFIWFPLLKNLLFPRPPRKKGYKYLWNYRSTISCNNKQRVYQTHNFHIDDGFKIVSKLKNILITIHVIHMFMKHGVSIT